MSLEGIAAILTALGLLLGAFVGYRKFSTAQAELREARERAARVEAGESHVDLLRTAIEAYGANVTQLQAQLTDTRNAQNADRDRHSREMSEVRAALSRCEHERVDQAAELARLNTRLETFETRRAAGDHR